MKKYSFSESDVLPFDVNSKEIIKRRILRNPNFARVFGHLGLMYEKGKIYVTANKIESKHGLHLNTAKRYLDDLAKADYVLRKLTKSNETEWNEFSYFLKDALVSDSKFTKSVNFILGGGTYSKKEKE